MTDTMTNFFTVTEIDTDEAGLDSVWPWSVIFVDINHAMADIKAEYEESFGCDDAELVNEDRGGTTVVWCKGQDHGVHYLIEPVYLQADSHPSSTRI